LIDLDKELQKLETNWDILDGKAQRLEFWKTGFSSSGIPSMLIDEAVPFMNEKVAYYLDKFTNGRYIVSFDTLAATKAGEFRDKISVNVVDTYTRANSRVQLSGGQTRIIDIATILTLGDLQENIQDVSINILLFDEIFDSLDEENIGYVSKVLTKLKYGKSIYLISHRHEDQIEADETLTLR
jgi:DNA repair exonuclease SbcCD ATPase subunit